MPSPHKPQQVQSFLVFCNLFAPLNLIRNSQTFYRQHATTLLVCSKCLPSPDNLQSALCAVSNFSHFVENSINVRSLKN